MSEGEGRVRVWKSDVAIIKDCIVFLGTMEGKLKDVNGQATSIEMGTANTIVHEARHISKVLSRFAKNFKEKP